jgi:uncharacterized protein (TIGR02391 family)
MPKHNPLVLKFDPQTVDHLGAKMYSHLPNAVAELIANAYDADATKADVVISKDGSILIGDDGHGMSRADVSEKYLHIGRNRRSSTNSTRTESGLRSVSGKKGLGKLALFGIGKNIRLHTTRAGYSVATEIELSYDAMMAAKGEYSPTERQVDSLPHMHGTVVTLTNLKRSSAIDPVALAKSLSKLFNYADSDFAVTVIDANGKPHAVTPSLRMEALPVEFKWQFPEAWSEGIEDAYARERDITGTIVSTVSPVGQGLRGITLYVNGRLANEPEYFGASESSFAYSYLTGFLNVDFLDGLDPDVIATDRRAIDWNTDETAKLQVQLQSLVLRIGGEWRALRNAARKEKRDRSIGNTEVWVSSVRSSEQEPLRDLVYQITSDKIDMTATQQSEMLQLVKDVVPPHAEFVWRHLHPEIQDATKTAYISEDYYRAVEEAIKRYISAVSLKSGHYDPETTKMLSKAFGENGALRVFEKYMVGGGFNPSTGENIERAQKHVSMGVIAGFRNPMAHEEIAKLQSSGAFTNDDCLDALSIVSHLMRRLDDAKSVAASQETEVALVES